MKKLIIILAVTLFSLSTKAQTEYILYMDSVGAAHINTVKQPQVAISGYYSNLIDAPTFHTAAITNVTRPINSTNYTISTTYIASLSYNISISCTATIGGTSSGSVALQYSTNSGSTWTTIATLANSNTVTLAVALQSVTVQQACLSGFIPANALVRMVSTTTGTTTITYAAGQELY